MVADRTGLGVHEGCPYFLAAYLTDLLLEGHLVDVVFIILTPDFDLVDSPIAVRANPGLRDELLQGLVAAGTGVHEVDRPDDGRGTLIADLAGLLHPVVGVVTVAARYVHVIGRGFCCIVLTG